MVTRSALPQNYVLQAPAFVEDMGDVSEWTKSGDVDGAFSADTSDTKYGSQSIVVTPTTVSPGVTITKSINQSFFGAGPHGKMWLKSPSTVGVGSPVVLEVSPVSNFTTKFQLVFSRAGVKHSVVPGEWFHRAFDSSDWVATGAISWDDTMKYMRFRFYDAGAEYKIAGLEMGLSSRPKLIIGFDGGYSTDYSYVFPYMAARGLKATHYIYGGSIGSSASYCTLSQLQEMYAAGHAISVYPFDPLQAPEENLTDKDVAGQTETLRIGRDWLIANGMPRAARHVGYRHNACNDGTFTAMAALGMHTGRSASANPLCVPMNNNYKIVCRMMDQGTTGSWASIKTRIDTARKSGSSIMVCMHHVTDDPTVDDATLEQFASLIDYALQYKPEMDTVTIDEWYNGLTNPRYRSLPVGRA